LAETEPTPDPSDPSPRRASFRELAVVVLACATALAGIGIWGRSRLERARIEDLEKSRLTYRYAGEASCRECHPGESALYHRSGHATTLRKTSERPDLLAWLDGRQARDPVHPETTFRYALKDGTVSVARADLVSEEPALLEWAFGSGHHASTFVTVTDPDPDHPSGLEHRLTVYADGPKLDVTPGQSGVSDVDPRSLTANGRILDTRHLANCFECHTTLLSDRSAEMLDVATLIPNVSCERCHGPARDHVEAARAGKSDLKMPFGTSRAEPALKQIRLCGQCHRLPGKVQPASIRPDNNHLARYQPIGLMESKCFKGSEGALSCTTCHDPHARASSEAASYESTCIKCHKAAPQRVCGVSKDKGCVGCHMPRRDAGQNVLYADHWIRIHPETAPTSKPATTSR
jgi:hypothetical protein